MLQRHAWIGWKLKPLNDCVEISQSLAHLRAQYFRALTLRYSGYYTIRAVGTQGYSRGALDGSGSLELYSSLLSSYGSLRS